MFFYAILTSSYGTITPVIDEITLTLGIVTVKQQDDKNITLKMGGGTKTKQMCHTKTTNIANRQNCVSTKTVAACSRENKGEK